MNFLDENKKEHTHKKEAVTVVIPTLNEEQNLLPIIEKCRKYCSEIIVVDGHSTDNTVEIARKAGAKIIYDNKKGKGDALRTCIPHISREITVFIDADGSHDPDDIPKLVQPILEDSADHVTGSRLLGGSSELHGGFDEFMRLIGSSVITGFIGWRFKKRISDSQNGFRSIKTELLRNLDLKENITTIEQEMIIKTLKKGYRLGEVPTHEYKRKYGKSHIKIRKVAFRYVFSMIKYLFF
ncbi:MAG: glycosyltransferase family 2 protein [Candidatus Aminicenantes bacterium]|nr:glycosyltransferase family 2 protein [Candidatus Aminicenantes bacterium]